MAQHQQNYRKTLRSALANRKLADTIIDTIYDLQVWVEDAGGTIASKISLSNITRSSSTPYILTNDKTKRAFRAALGNRKMADLILNILMELDGYCSDEVEEVTKFICIDEVSVKEISSIVTVADIAGSLDGKYFVMQELAGSVAFWIDVDDSGTAEPAHGADRSIEITTITTGMTAAQVGDEVYNAIIADGSFEAGSNDNAGNLTIQNAEFGVMVDAADGDAGFTISESTPGVDSVLDGKYFVMQDDAGSVAFWIDVDDSGTAEPAHGADRSVEITTITAGMTAAQVGTAVYNAVIGDSEFALGSDGLAGTIYIKNDSSAKINAVDGDTGFAISEYVVGIVGADISNIIDEQYTVQSSPTAATAKKILAASLCHRQLADAIVDMILELQVQFRDNTLGTCSGTLVYSLIA